MKKKIKKTRTLDSIKNRFHKIMKDADKVKNGKVEVYLNPQSKLMTSDEEVSTLLNSAYK